MNFMTSFPSIILLLAICNRQFGISGFGQSKKIYTKGADRVTNWYHSIFENSAFSGADDLWYSFEEKVVEFINENGGQASKFDESQQRAFRPNWADVRNKLKSDVPINHVSCL
jgi:hypothetical protein